MGRKLIFTTVEIDIYYRGKFIFNAFEVFLIFFTGALYLHLNVLASHKL